MSWRFISPNLSTPCSRETGCSNESNFIFPLFQVALLLDEKSPNQKRPSSSSDDSQFIPEVIRLELEKIGLQEEASDTNENKKISFYEGNIKMLFFHQLFGSEIS